MRSIGVLTEERCTRIGLYWFSSWNGMLNANAQTQRKHPKPSVNILNVVILVPLEISLAEVKSFRSCL